MKSYWFCLRSNCISSSLFVKKMHECFLWVYQWCEKRLWGGRLSLLVWLNKFVPKSLKGFGTDAEICFRRHWRTARTNTAHSFLQRKDDWTVTSVVLCGLWRTRHTKHYCPLSRRMHKQLTKHQYGNRFLHSWFCVVPAAVFLCSPTADGVEKLHSYGRGLELKERALPVILNILVSLREFRRAASMNIVGSKIWPLYAFLLTV